MTYKKVASVFCHFCADLPTTARHGYKLRGCFLCTPAGWLRDHEKETSSLPRAAGQGMVAAKWRIWHGPSLNLAEVSTLLQAAEEAAVEGVLSLLSSGQKNS